MEFVEEREKLIDEQEKEMEEMKKMHFEEMLDLERESDYFWYLTDITIGAGDRLLKTGDYPFLTIWSDGLVLHVFVNGQLASNIKKNDQSFSCLIL